MIGSSDNDYFKSKLQAYALTHFALFWKIVNNIPPLARWFNRQLINSAVLRSKPRPNVFSTASDFTSWESLTDKTWFGRHLPSEKREMTLPPAQDVAKLFDRAIRKPGKPIESGKSTLLFPSFAQWFTDGFLLTNPGDPRKTHTNHDIDFSPLYGLTKVQTDCLRLKSEKVHERGRLKTQTINGEEYAPYYFDSDGVTVRSEFKSLLPPLHLQPNWPVAKRCTLFAFGGERANSTPQTAMMNTLFLREHNRLARLLEDAHPGDWDDERVFQTARNIVVAMLIKIVVEEYINHISPYHFKFLADPSACWTADWNRPNWIAVEFNLLYRWHSLVPDEFDWPGTRVRTNEWILNNAPLTYIGLAAAFVTTSEQSACNLGLYNTTADLMQVEIASINQGRANRLRTYNDYREAVGFPKATTFEQISSDPVICAELKRLYIVPENVEFYVGLFAENSRSNAAVMALIGRFVAIDAFSQALTNPLLSPQVYNEDTFDPLGMKVLKETNCLEDILNRNVSKPVLKGTVTMTK